MVVQWGWWARSWWKPQRSRPLSRSVRPPWDQGVGWWASVKAAGTGRDPANQLKQAGVKNVTYYEAPGTAHKFQTWRKSLFEFAPLLFRN